MSEPFNARIDFDNQPTVFTMGLGTVVVGAGHHEGMPSIYFCAARKPGLLDADATPELFGRSVPSDAVIIRFASMEAVLRHLDTVKKMVATLPVKEDPPQSGEPA